MHYMLKLYIYFVEIYSFLNDNQSEMLMWKGNSRERVMEKQQVVFVVLLPGLTPAERALWRPLQSAWRKPTK